MKKRTLLKSFFLMVFLVTIFIFAAAQSAVSEMTLNDNVNIEGDIFLNGTGGGINFPDGSEQRTAASPPWSKIITTGRFELVLGGDAVLDHETGLVWQRDTSIFAVEWVLAQLLCYELEIGGRMGWRLPTMDELATLIEKGHEPEPALPTGHPFTNVKGQYWSSSTSVLDTHRVWRINFYDGYVGLLYINDPENPQLLYVRAVRSGQ